MAWWDRFRRGGPRPAPLEVRIDEFCAENRGVEAFLEPATSLSGSSVVLVAHDGRWLRLPAPDLGQVRAHARRRGLPCYDAPVVGYPQRMRDYERRRRLRGDDH